MFVHAAPQGVEPAASISKSQRKEGKNKLAKWILPIANGRKCEIHMLCWRSSTSVVSGVRQCTGSSKPSENPKPPRTATSTPPTMSKFGDFVKNGWHPEKQGTTFKGQVKGLVGRGESKDDRNKDHVSRPLHTLTDPSSLPPPPQRRGTGLAPGPAPTSSGGSARAARRTAPAHRPCRRAGPGTGTAAAASDGGAAAPVPDQHDGAAD
ncbi:hypothetical protein BBAD15_g4838 [Beauveria bassiana D1-5]|uniref:Uncharacterized protein n=1 Tax=Beauveria bassiana D1-5 TaxID=1245745 RepID=A0A0A2VTZ6_BEABA|nr:hypothetical protein BBAD15_g4838 [Beauveria bassiana D1-5]